MKKPKEFKVQDLDVVVDNALNSAVFEIQTHLGIKSGDTAGMFFSGSRWDELKGIMMEYVRHEESCGEYPFRLKG